MHEKTAGTKKAPALDYGATAPGQNGLPHPVTGLTVTGRTVARVRGEGKVWRDRRCRAYSRSSTPVVLAGGLFADPPEFTLHAADVSDRYR